METILILAVVGQLAMFAMSVAFALSFTRGAQKITEPGFCQELVQLSGVSGVHFYAADIDRRTGVVGFAVHVPFYKIIVMDRRAMVSSDPREFVFWVAHELGHHALGHCRRDFWLTATFLMLLFPKTPAVIALSEDEADAFAERITGISRYDAARKLWA